MASGNGLGRLARDAAFAGRSPRVQELAGGDHEAVRGEHVVAAAREADADALEIIDAYAWWVAVGLANLANVLDPAVLVLGGGVVGGADVLLPPIRSAFTSLVLASAHRPETPIVAAELGEHAGAIGAALLA
jgi:glucokinase